MNAKNYYNEENTGELKKKRDQSKNMRKTKQYACSRQRILENKHEINHDGFKDYYVLRMNRDVSPT